MILCDTSAWVHYLNHEKLDFSAIQRVCICPPIIQELLQGVAAKEVYTTLHQGLMALPRIADPLPLKIFVEAASIYRQGRKRGLTIRSSVDCLIAAIAIAEGVPIHHMDRDFEAIAQYTELETTSSLF